MAEKKISVSLEGRMDGLSRTLQQAETETERHTRAMSGSFARVDSGIMSVGLALGTLAGGAFGLAAVKEAAKQADIAAVSLAVTARYAGEEITATNEAARELATDGLITVSEASKGLQNLLSRGFNLQQSVELMNRFKDAAAFNRQASLEFGEAIVTATEGLRNENSVLVDNAGVTKNVSVMWKEYAAEHGLSADKLTQSQKRHAELNGILRETEGQAGNAALMAESLAGAEARAAQEAFELKTALGTALQPAMQGVLGMFSPVLSGLRDMVYWVETLGARAGGVYDKIKIRLEGKFSLPEAGEATGFRERDKRIAERLAEVDRNVEATIEDIVQKSLGGTTPNIGNDSGARRKDVIIPATEAEKRAEATRKQAEATRNHNEHQRQLNEGMKVGAEMVQLYSKELQELADIQRQMDQDAAEAEGNSEGRLNYYGRMSDSQQQSFDLTAMLRNWEAIREEHRVREEKAELDHVWNMGEIQQTMINDRLFAEGRERELILSNYGFKRSQADAQLAWTLEHTALEESEVRRIKEASRQQQLLEEQRLLSDLTAADARARQRQLDGTMQFTNASANLFGALYEISGKKLKAFFYIQQTANAASAVMSGYKAGAAALEPPPIGLGPVAGGYLSALMIAGGFASAAAIMAQTVMGPSGRSGGGSYGGGGSSYGGGLSSSPVVTQPNYNQTSQMGSMTFIIQGNVMEDKYVEERLIPLLNSAGTRNVRVEYLN